MKYSSLKVLVVDDMGSIRALIRALLNEIGIHEIAEASDGRKALDYLEMNDVNLLICDWNMPNMTGREVLASIREHDKLKALPMLMVTAERSREQVEDAIRLGVNSYVTKPFNAATLKERIIQCLSGPTAS